MYKTFLKNIFKLSFITTTLSVNYLHAVEVSDIADLGVGYNDSVAIDSNNNIYVSNTGFFVNGAGNGNSIFKVTLDGDVSVFANLISPLGNSVDKDDNLYSTGTTSANSNGNYSLYKFAPDGTRTLFSNFASNLRFNSQDQPYGANCFTNVIYQYDENGNSTVFSSSPLLNCPVSIVFDEEDIMYAASFNNGNIVRIDKSGNATLLTVAGSGAGRMTYVNGYMYSTAFNSNQILRISTSGEVSVVAGSGLIGQENGDGEVATFNQPNGIAALPDGSGLVVSQYGAFAQNLRLIKFDLPKVDIANDDEISIDEDNSITFSPLENDSGVDSDIDVTSVTVTVQPLHGTTEVSSTTGEVTYQPDENYNGTDEFSYTVKNTEGAYANDAIVRISIAPLVDEPISMDDNVSLEIDTSITITVLDNDTDPDNGTLSYDNVSIITQPAQGAISIGTSDITYTPNTGYTGNDSFEYSVSNESGLTSENAMVNIVVNNTQPTTTTPTTTATTSSGGGGGSIHFVGLLFSCLIFIGRLMKINRS